MTKSKFDFISQVLLIAIINKLHCVLRQLKASCSLHYLNLIHSLRRNYLLLSNAFEMILQCLVITGVEKY